jgi:DNA invertase Pin-like site-specific DNA recombinase
MKAVVYGVKSSPDEKESVADQHRLTLEAIEREGDREVVGPFGEQNQSGYRKERGPELEAAFRAAIAAAAEDGEAELWVWHSSRLARGDGRKGKRSIAKIVNDLLYENVTVRSVADPEMVSPMLAGIGSKVSNQYAADLSAHTKRGIRKRRVAGKPFGGVPFGYVVEKKIVEDKVVARRIEDPKLGPIVVQVFERIADHQRTGDVGRWLTANGHLTKRGKPQTADSVRLLITNELYAGTKGYPALVSQELFNDAQEALVKADPVATKAREGGRPPDPAYTLRGIPGCRSCGSALYSTRRYGRGERSYTCASKMKALGCSCPPIPAALLEAHVLDHLDRFMDSVEDWIADVMAERSGERHVHEDELEHQQDVLLALDRQRDERMAEVEEQGTNPILMEAITRIDAKRETQAQRIAEVESMLAEWTPAAGVDEALDFYAGLMELVQGRVKQAQGSRELNEALCSLLAGMWAEIRDGKLMVEFELRAPLGKTPRVAWVSTGRGWLPPVAVSQTPDQTSIQSVCRRFSEASTSRMIQRRELPA